MKFLGFFGVYHEDDAVAEEIDVFGEYLLITFDTPQVISSIPLAASRSRP